MYVRTTSSPRQSIISHSRKSSRHRQLSNCSPCSSEGLEQYDIYGFNKSSQHVPLHRINEFEARYQSIMGHKRYQWDQMLAENGGDWPEKSPKLRRYIRKGIPRCYRAQAWFHYSGALGLLQKNPHVYKSLVQSAEMMGSHNEHRNLIEQDLHRTFPDNQHLRCQRPEIHSYEPYSPACVPKIQSLRNVLMALSIYSPAIGYCQSLNFIAGMLLLSIEDEEQVFWVMVITTSHILPSNTYDITMEGASIDQLTLLWLIFDKFPEIWSRISNDVPFWELEQYERPPPSTLVTTHWFLTLFANVLPPEASPLITVFRVWDIFFFEGHVVLFRVALAILDLNSEALLNAEDAMEIFQIMQILPKQAIDCNQLLDVCISLSYLGYDLLRLILEL
ncbi:hypothetical protein INT43_002579 [Umbelopsis isabellina]|uniref:Rab-GAP TBC domain-containing protein n=1 Tax=Mortierella isabellina TaxID=91625 RepID=A0A8H7UHL3_MORIS|nr:hypothetical protein INT43_002579 [Umbelopsis isabellina]